MTITSSSFASLRSEPARDENDAHHRLLLEFAGLQEKLRSLPVIEQAKGILMGRFGVADGAAFALLRRWSSHANFKLRDVATALVDGAASPSGVDRVIEEFQAVTGRVVQRRAAAHHADRVAATCAPTR